MSQELHLDFSNVRITSAEYLAYLRPAKVSNA